MRNGTIRLLTALLLLVGLTPLDSVQADPGDTTWVQTLTFDSITTRRGWFQFPDDNKSYRRILMYYTLKCDPATAADGFDCGEWDYLTYSNIWDHTGVMDSTLLSHPNFTVNGTTPDNFSYSNSANWNFYQHWQYQQMVTGIVSMDSAIVGTGNSSSSETLPTQNKQGHSQYIYTASELIAAGLTAGNITALRLNIDAAGSQADWLQVRMKQTGLTALGPNSFEQNGLTTVYNQHTAFAGIGWQTLYFVNDFVWDGTSNVVVDFTFHKPITGNTTAVLAENTGANTGIWTAGEDSRLDFEGPDYVSVPAAVFATIDQEVTISFWQYGDPVLQPQNDYLFEGRDANGVRVLGTHLPWSNGSVFWDAGNAGGTAYDRISKAANTADFAGQWNHWAMTKNTATGDMRIYLNGNLWHSGTGMNRSMAGITGFVIGANALNFGGNYDGFVDEFRVWDVELDQATIQDWMNKDVTGSHPNATNLRAYYQFNEGTGYAVSDASGNGFDAVLSGMPQWQDYDGDLWRNLTETQLRPNTIFEQGQYNAVLDSTLVIDSVLNQQQMVILYQNTSTPNIPTDTIFVWEEGYAYTFDPSGTKVDSTFQAGSTQLTRVDNDYYSEPFEVIDRYEFGRFITPYGIGLSLGDDGFRWMYDVTDYAPLLKGMVDMNSGNQQELIDVRFAMIEGTPAREVKEINRLWGGRASHRYSALSDDTQLSATTVDLHPESGSYKVKTRITGHGHNSDNGSFPHCCEWKDNTHYLLVNGTEVADWHVWQYTECSLNPVYPQGGTWPGAREGWCPGDVVKEFEYEISDYVSGNTVSLDYDITKVPTNNLGMGNGNYVMAMQLMQYGAPNFTHDAELYDVIAPNSWEYYSRKNPICAEPKVVIRNGGTETLTSLKIRYFVKEDRAAEFTWTGSLDFMDTEEITLPISDIYFFEMNGKNKFHVELSEPNGQADENTENDHFSSTFEVPNLLTDRIVIEMNSNARAIENSYTMKDFTGTSLLSRSDLADNTVYRDTFDLDHGCYTIELLDQGNDGLSYWIDPAAGSGSFRIWQLNDDNSVAGIQTFESEFGTSIQYTFSVGFSVGMDDDRDAFELVEVYPNPSAGVAFVNLVGVPGPVQLMVTDALGRVVQSQVLNEQNGSTTQVDLSAEGNGWYFFNFITEDGRKFTRKMILSK